jgi:HD-like signal output (HDOD) protein
MKILIVDDELVSRTKLKLIMENFGECETAKHGKDAIALFHYGHYINEPFNLIMLDINLPELDGITVLSEIRRAEQYLNISKSYVSKILMATSYGDKDRIVACVQSGCDEYIVKPFDADVINQKLAKLGIIDIEPIPPSETSDSNSPLSTGTSRLVEEIYSFLGGREINLPSLPGIKAKFRKMIATGAVFQQISNLLKKDLAISVELIRMSNSAYYKGVKKNKSLEQAIARLGYAATEQVVSEMTGRKFVTMRNKKYRFLIETLWKHSLACAYTSEITTKLLHLDLSADSFSLGLLHDIGKLALLQIIANIEHRGRLKEEISTAKLVDTINEQHCVFGAKILEKWKYAQSYVHSALYHDSPELEEEDISTELLIVNFANLVAKSLGFDLNAEQPADIDLENAESALRLKITPSQITKTKEKVIEEMNDVLKLF